ncbi:MAG: EamA family transporter [Clostridia bacterium]|nr:EamA family transporter [Clostridia bacterium]
MTRITKGIVLVLLSALSFSFMPIFIVFAYRDGADTSTVLLIRFVSSTIMFFTYLKIKNISVKIPKHAIISFVILGGFGYTIQSRFYFSALHYISPAMATMFLYTYPIIVGILSYVVDKEKPTFKLVIATFISIMGLVLILGSSLGKVNIIGILFASGASLVYSLYIVYSNRVIKKTPPIVSCAYIALFSSFGTLAMGTATGGFNFNLTIIAWISIFGIALFSTVIAMTTFFQGMEYIGPTRTSIISLMEAVFTVILSLLILKEGLSPIQLLGGVGVLVGAYLVAKSN